MTGKLKVLVADASKVVRASLAKQLADQFEIREEAGGESAWQTLVLDSAVVGVISGMTLNTLDGIGLLERLRESKLKRLNTLPFFLMVSNSFEDAQRKRAQDLRVTDFVSKDADNAWVDNFVRVLAAHAHGGREPVPQGEAPATTGKPEGLPESPVLGDDDIVRTDVGVTNIMGRLGEMEGLESSDGAAGAGEDDEQGVERETQVYSVDQIEDCLARVLPNATSEKGVGVITFGLDNYKRMMDRYGSELLGRTVQKFSFMLARKIRPEDTIGLLPAGRVAIVTPATTPEICSRFANRICKAMATAQIAVRGQRIDMTVSAGIAVVPEEGVALSAQQLMNLAFGRLDDAQRAGGNQIVAHNAKPVVNALNSADFMPRLKELLDTVDPAALRPCLGSLGMQLMPLLKELENNFRFGLPLDEMHRRLWDRARTERLS